MVSSMSTLRTVNIQHPSATTNNITLNSDGTLGEASFSNYPGKNAIINGNFSVWQRGTSLTTLPAGQYLADRWAPNLFQTCRVQRVTNSFSGSGPRSQYAVRVSSPTAVQVTDGSRMVLTQPIESVNAIHFRGKTVTLSFWVRFSSATFSSISNTGESSYDNFIAEIDFFTSTTDASMISTFPNSLSSMSITNGSLPTSWTKYKFTATVPNNINNIYVRFGFNARGSTAVADTNWYEMTEIQLEEGSFATPFEYESFETTLRKCQRYYEKSYPYATLPGTSGELGSGFVANTNALAGSTAGGISGALTVPFKVTKRTTPTMTAYDFDGTINAVRVYPADQKRTGVTGLANIRDSGAFQFLSFNNTSATAIPTNGAIMFSWTADAEL